LISSLTAALAPLETLDRSRPHDLSELARCHREVLMELSRDRHGAAVAFEDAHGSALTEAFDDLLGGQSPRRALIDICVPTRGS
jgi:ATP-dependent helicase/nuclease subunit B